MLATDDGASMVGKIALVPTHNRLSELGLTFYHGLFDENVSSHMALGNGITGVVRGSERLTADERHRSYDRYGRAWSSRDIPAHSGIPVSVYVVERFAGTTRASKL
jgi:Thermophilic metalloprotease (M29)